MSYAFINGQWNDSMVPASGSFQGGGTAIASVQWAPSGFGSFYSQGMDNTDKMQMAIQIPHGIKGQSIIKPHVHWTFPVVADATHRNVRFQLEYSWANINGVFPTPTLGNAVEVDLFPGGVATPILTHKITSFDDIVLPAGDNISGILMMSLARIAATGNEYTVSAAGRVYILGVDIHFQADSVGSLNPTSKI